MSCDGPPVNRSSNDDSRFIDGLDVAANGEDDLARYRVVPAAAPLGPVALAADVTPVAGPLASLQDDPDIVLINEAGTLRRLHLRNRGRVRDTPGLPHITLHMASPPHALAAQSVLSFGYEISKRGLHNILDAAFEPHRAALTVPLAEKGGFAANVRWRRPQQQRVLRMYSETPTKFIVPYAYGLCRWGMPALSLRTEGVPICDDAEMSTEPRPYQEEVIDAVYAQICGDDPTKLQSVIVKAGCGWGKTFFAILLAIDRRRGIRRKAIFTVSQDAHRVQLQRAIAKYTRGVRVGLVQGKQFDVADKDIIIAMVDTLTMTVPGGRGPGGSRYTAEHFGDCGLWVADEAHHIESECFSRLHQLLRPRVTVCLTATPERGDGSTPALFNNLGPVVVERGNAYDGPREAHMVYYTDPNHDPLQQPQKSMALSFVAADKQRTRSCARLMLIHYLRPEPLPVKRKILVLSARICLLDDLAAVLAASMLRALPALAPGETRTTQRSRNRKVIQIVRMTPGVQLPVVEFSIGYITGKMADDELAASAACNFILASMPKGAEGLDLPEADEVWFMTLQKKTEQPRGRVLRLCESKNTARAVFVVDTHIAYFANMAKGILYNDLALAPIAPEQPWQLFTLQLKVDAERGA